MRSIGRCSRNRAYGLLVMSAALVLAGCSSGGEVSAFTPADPGPTASVQSEPTVDPTGVPGDDATQTSPTVVPSPTTSVTLPPTPTVTPEPSPVPDDPVPVDDPLDDIDAGDCVQGVDDNASLEPAPCRSHRAEGRVVRRADRADISCPNADLTVGRTTTDTDGVSTEHGFCIDYIPALRDVFGDIDSRCDITDPGPAEEAAITCRLRNREVVYVRLRPGTRPSAYVQRVRWTRDPSVYGTWNLAGEECGTVYEGRAGRNVQFVSTFDHANYAVRHRSTDLTADQLGNQLSFRVSTRLCPG